MARLRPEAEVGAGHREQCGDARAGFMEGLFGRL